jgi:hypothetical protein
MAASVLSATDMDTRNFAQNNASIAISPKQRSGFQISNNGSNFFKSSKTIVSGRADLPWSATPLRWVGLDAPLQLLTNL